MTRLLRIVTVLAWLAASPAFAASPGALKGTVVNAGAGLGGVTVLVHETGAFAVTDSHGAFTVENLPAGTYTVSLALGENTLTQTGVAVAGGAATAVTWSVTWDAGLAETITVVSASRRRERIVDAPGAVTTVLPDALALTAPGGQVPALLAGALGVEVTQSGLYDFNLNTRGFNGFLTRRIQTIVDGRDPSPGTSSQEWWTLDPTSGDIETLELARGPSAALYGPNSFNGVLNIVTKAPRDSQGFNLLALGGAQNTAKVNVRWAGAAGREWFVKVQANHAQSDNFAVSRNAGVEYAGLPAEVVPLTGGGLLFNAASARADRYFADGRMVTVEGGLTQGRGETALTPAGRAQQGDIQRSFARANLSAPAWNVTAAFNRRTGQSLLLGAGATLDEKGTTATVDGQTHRFFWHGKSRVVLGASFARKWIDSANARGVQTLYFAPVTSDQGAAFGQMDVDLTPRFKLVGAGRWDNSTLHSAQVSPKVVLVASIAPEHKVRVGYNQAFQVANYTELFVNVPAAPPVDLSALEAAFKPALASATLGLSTVPVFVQGNPSLGVEQIRALEVGYTGVFGTHVLASVDVYQEWLRDFISDYLPNANPNIALYRPPASVPAPLAAVIAAVANAAVPGLTNLPTGAPAIIYSTGNFGRIASHGIEASLRYFARAHWQLGANYGWLSDHVVESHPGAAASLNAPEHRFNATATYAEKRWSAQATLRAQSAFTWTSGVFTGPVPAFGVVDLQSRIHLAPHWDVGTTVTNLFDRRHYEAFGGDVLGRLGLVYLAISN